jgi:hypothetical protein
VNSVPVIFYVALNKFNESAILTAYSDSVQFNAVTLSPFQFFQMAIFQESFSEMRVILYEFIFIHANLCTSFLLDLIVVIVTT